jgi:hypothetical protein
MSRPAAALFDCRTLPTTEGDVDAKKPRVFISYATEDKNRFATDFATRLREEGVDAWYAEWEILPGDSLVDRIFEKGIGNMDAFIIVLSSISVTKRWVKEELDAAVVSRIERGTRLIPVLIEDCEVPESVKATAWIRIADTAHYDHELKRVLAAIFEHRARPAIGSPPPYAATPRIGGLSRADSTVLRRFVERGIEEGGLISIDTEEVWEIVKGQGVPRQEFEDSLDVLNDNRYLKEIGVLAPVQPAYSVTPSGFHLVAEHYLPEYPKHTKDIAGLIANKGVTESGQIAEQLVIPHVMVRAILEQLDLRGLIRVESFLGGQMEVVQVKPQLRRFLRGD